MSVTEIQRRDWEDIGFTAVAHAVGEYHVHYTVYAIEGVEENGTVLLHRAGADSWPDPVSSLGEAEIYLHGEVKWDGCSNWHFDEQDRLMLHGCSRKDLMNIGEVMARCWDWTKELLSTFEG